jgi:hypothetical protein
MNRRLLIIYLIFGIVCWLFSTTTLATSDYVLPYPGPMPGNRLHSFMVLIDKLQGWWSWGTITQFNYQLAMADKAIVEAKTLAEYKQYLLAMTALDNSNQAFQTLPGQLVKAKIEGKDINKLARTLISAAETHITLLERLRPLLPEMITWTPEKSASTELLLQARLSGAISSRQEVKKDLEAFLVCLDAKADSAGKCWDQRQQWYLKPTPLPEIISPTDESPFQPSANEPYL